MWTKRQIRHPYRNADELLETIMVTGSTSSRNDPSTYQKALTNLHCTPSNVLLSQQDLYLELHFTSTSALCEVVITLCVGLDSSDSPTSKMQNRTEKFGAQLPLFAPASSSQQHLFRKSTTYLAKIAVILQDAPGKMLTFTQVRKSQDICNNHLWENCIGNTNCCLKNI